VNSVSRGKRITTKRHEDAESADVKLLAHYAFFCFAPLCVNQSVNLGATTANHSTVYVFFSQIQMTMKKTGLLSLIFLLSLSPLLAQQPQPLQDTSYYKTFPEHLTTRLYFSRKYTSLKIQDKQTDKDYLYMPNSTLNMGVGATYKMLTLNLAYGFGFLNPEKGKGETKYLDAQAHIYPRKMVIDLFLQFYKGFHLTDGLGAGVGENYLTRPDMKIQKIGASVQYVFNHGR